MAMERALPDSAFPAVAEEDEKTPRVAAVAETELSRIRGTHLSFRKKNIKQIPLREIYNEYYGLEEFEDKPIPGGFDAVDRKYKPREWRPDWKPSDQGFFSRVKRVATALRASRDDSSDCYPTELGEQYDEALKSKGLLGVLQKMQETGLVEAGPPRKCAHLEVA